MAEDTKSVRYVGPHRRVVVDLPEGAVACDQGESVKVPAADAKRLLAQPTWEATGRQGGKRKTDDDSKE